MAINPRRKIAKKVSGLKKETSDPPEPTPLERLRGAYKPVKGKTKAEMGPRTLYLNTLMFTDFQELCRLRGTTASAVINELMRVELQHTKAKG